MKRIFLTAATMFALLHAHAQTAIDTTGFNSRKLKVEEINFISSYYHQDGNNASVTGGIGSEKLTDIHSFCLFTDSLFNFLFYKCKFIASNKYLNN